MAEEVIRNCPECKTTMRKMQKFGVILDICPNCEGIYFDYEELGQVADSMEKPGGNFEKIDKGDSRPDHNGIAYICACCQTPMEERNYHYDSGIHIDLCPNCFGVYLNKGELDEIKKYIYSLENSAEGKMIDKKAEIISQGVDEAIENKVNQLSQEVDDLYKTDDMLGMDKVVDLIFRRSL